VVLLTVGEVFCYRLPPRPAAAGHRAADWGLESPAVTGWLRVTAVAESEVVVIVWSRADAGGPSSGSGAAASLTMAPASAGNRIVAACRIPFTPPPSRTVWGEHPLAYWLEPVVDSTRYFVMRGASPRPGAPPAMLGIGFRDRQHAFDLKSAIMDHATFVERQRRGAAEGSGDRRIGGDEGGGGAGSEDADGVDVGGIAGLEVEVAERAEVNHDSGALASADTSALVGSLAPLRAGERIVVKLGGGVGAAGGTTRSTTAGGAGGGGGTGGKVVPKLAPPRSAAAAAPAPATVSAPAVPPAGGEAAVEEEEEWGDFVVQPADAPTEGSAVGYGLTAPASEVAPPQPAPAEGETH
jgi:hypothetical protein